METLTADSVSKHYGRNTILNNVFIKCETGKITGLLGRNGSGKSTLLSVIFGRTPAEYKHVRINDRYYKTPYKSGKLFLLHQATGLPGGLTVKSLIALFCDEYREAILNIAFVASKLNAKLNNLSGGERRYLLALVAIYCNAPIVLMDEPFSQIAPLWVEDLLDRIRAMKVRKAFLITDHLYEHLLNICDEITLLHNHSNYVIRTREDLVTHNYLPALP